MAEKEKENKQAQSTIDEQRFAKAVENWRNDMISQAKLTSKRATRPEGVEDFDEDIATLTGIYGLEDGKSPYVLNNLAELTDGDSPFYSVTEPMQGDIVVEYSKSPTGDIYRKTGRYKGTKGKTKVHTFYGPYGYESSDEDSARKRYDYYRFGGRPSEIDAWRARIEKDLAKNAADNTSEPVSKVVPLEVSEQPSARDTTDFLARVAAKNRNH